MPSKSIADKSLDTRQVLIPIVVRCASQLPAPFNDTRVGCNAPGTIRVKLADQQGNDDSLNPVRPCFGHETLASLLTAGSLYGVAGGSSKDCNCGIVFKFAHNPDGTWTYSVLHRFHGWDGALPVAGVILDSKGHIYGTTTTGGAGGYGVVFKIKP